MRATGLVRIHLADDIQEQAALTTGAPIQNDSTPGIPDGE
jgi:hypothetical protein